MNKDRHEMSNAELPGVKPWQLSLGELLAIMFAIAILAAAFGATSHHNRLAKLRHIAPGQLPAK